MPIGNHDFHEITVSTVSANRTLTSIKYIAVITESSQLL